MVVTRLARYGDNGMLGFFDADVTTTEYVAISHVWGQAVWSQLPNLSSEILVSSHKAQFIECCLPALLQGLPFWMDVICINQRDPSARKAVVGEIPSIFRYAQRTIAIKDGDGLRSCCADAVSDFSDFVEFRHRLQSHLSSKHSELGLLESYLSRLWTLQELILSNTVQFVSCRDSLPDNREINSDFNIYTLDCSRIADGLLTLGRTWSAYGQSDDGDEWLKFIRVFLTCGTLARLPRRDPLQDLGLPENVFYEMFLNSTRTATVAADYVLAVFPQFDWYRLPVLFKRMSFSELFIDVLDQAKSSGHAFIPRFTSAMANSGPPDLGTAWQPTGEVPAPQSLGDFLKLMGNKSHSFLPTRAAFANLAMITDSVTTLNFSAAVNLIETSMQICPKIWAEAHAGELSKYGSWPREEGRAASFYRSMLLRYNFDHDTIAWELEMNARKAIVSESWSRLQADWYVDECRRILDLMCCGTGVVYKGRNDFSIGWPQYREWLLNAKPAFHQETLLYLAAMVNCLVPLSAFSWVQANFRPVTVQLQGGMKVLSLLSNQFSQCIRPAARYQYVRQELPPWPGFDVFHELLPRKTIVYVAERPCARRWPSGQDLVLIHPALKVPVGLFPNILYYLDDNETFVGQQLRLYQHAVKVRDDQVAVQLLPIETLAYDGAEFYDDGPYSLNDWHRFLEQGSQYGSHVERLPENWHHTTKSRDEA